MSENYIKIDITDYEYTILDDQQNVKEIKAAGKLTIKNPTNHSRLWNLNCDLKEVVNTNLSKELQIGTLNPDQEFKKEYTIDNIEAPNLEVSEIFDTERNTEKTNDTFLFNDKIDGILKISLKNKLELPILDITLKREIPDYLINIELKDPQKGNAIIGDEGGKKMLSWNISSLEEKSGADLEIEFSTNIQEKTDKNLGAMEVTYLVQKKKLSMITPVVKGLTDSMSGVSRDEGSNPGSWDCEVEFINESEFKVRLEDVKVIHKHGGLADEVVTESPQKEIEPDDAWDYNFSIESTDVPELDSEIIFTPLFITTTSIIGEIKKEPTFYPVLSAEITKTINPPEVAAYANTNMTIINTLPNKGTANINSLKLYDEIPKDFVPPEMKEIKLVAKTNEGELELQDRSEFIKKIEIDPPDQDPNIKHEIKVKLKDLASQLPPNSELVMTYPLLAKNPKPEEKYQTPVEAKLNSKTVGKFLTILPSEEPEIKIKYVKRKMKTLKSIKPGMSEGEFFITVRIQNKGDVELENIIVRDAIPSGFSLTEFNPPELEYKTVQDGDQSELESKIPVLEGNKSINIKYTCSGEGEYPRSEPQVIVKGRSDAASGKTIADKAEAGGQSTAPAPGKVSSLDASKQAKVSEFFKDITKRLNQSINATNLAELIEQGRETLPPGPILHQFLKYARELKEYGDKIVVGSLFQEVSKKLNEFKSKYL